MGAALITAVALSLLGLVASLVTGHTAQTQAEVLRHTTLAIFATLLVLLAHSMLMFYLIGKGKAIREAVAEGGLSGDFVRRVAHARAPVFSWATLAMALTMAAAIVGGGADTGTLPVALHTGLGYACVLASGAALRLELRAVIALDRITGEVNRLLGA